LAEEPKPGKTKRLKHAIDQTHEVRLRIEGSRGRVPMLDASLEVIERDSQVGGGILAGALAYRLFLFFLPLGFFLIAVLGLIASWTGTTPLRLSKDIGIVSLVTTEVRETAQKGSGFWVALVSIVVLAYVTTVLHRAVAVVHALAWENTAVPAKAGRSRKLFALGLTAQLVAIGLLGGFRPQSTLDYFLQLAALGVILAAIWLGMSLRLPHAGAPWTDLVPGAIVYGVGLLFVRAFDKYLLGVLHEQRKSSYGTLGTASAILLSLFLLGRLVVASAVINATLSARRRARGERIPPAGTDV
jgi:membrane protein